MRVLYLSVNNQDDIDSITLDQLRSALSQPRDVTKAYIESCQFVVAVHFQRFVGVWRLDGAYTAERTGGKTGGWAGPLVGEAVPLTERFRPERLAMRGGITKVDLPD